MLLKLYTHILWSLHRLIYLFEYVRMQIVNFLLKHFYRNTQDYDLKKNFFFFFFFVVVVAVATNTEKS